MYSGFELMSNNLSLDTWIDLWARFRGQVGGWMGVKPGLNTAYCSQEIQKEG